MITKEQANQTAAGELPKDDQDRDQGCASGVEGQGCAEFDYIDEAIEETMIASDPPPWTPQTGIGAPGRGADARQSRSD